MNTAERIYLKAIETHDWTPVTIKAKFNGTCNICGQAFAAGTEIACDPSFTPLGWAHTACIAALDAKEQTSMDVESGLGIGGIGSDDYNIHTEGEGPSGGYVHGSIPAGAQVCPAGTTYGQSDPDGRCAICGQPADWNPGAGQNLCDRHWDSY